MPDPNDPLAPAALMARAQGVVEKHAALLERLARLFAVRGESLYIVGGSVRDAMLGRGVHDLDFTTSARPDVIQEILGEWGEKVWDTCLLYTSPSPRDS